jgi:hypothetical protein
LAAASPMRDDQDWILDLRFTGPDVRKLTGCQSENNGHKDASYPELLHDKPLFRVNALCISRLQTLSSGIQPPAKIFYFQEKLLPGFTDFVH